MDIQVIKTFFSILKNGSFQEAAKELGYAQSTVTNHIQSLEAELGVVLLERGKKIRLTQAGELFKTPARHLLTEYENLITSVNEFSDNTKGVVQIGANEPIASHILPKILNDFRAQFPFINVEITIDTSITLNNMVIEGTLDFAICTLSTSDNDMSFFPILEFPILIAVPISHQLASKEKINLKDLRHERILIPRPQTSSLKKLEALLDKKIGPYEPVKITNMISPMSFVQNEFGIAFVSSIKAEPAIPGVVVKEIEDLKDKNVSGIFIKKDNRLLTPSTRNLVAFIKDNLSTKVSYDNLPQKFFET